MARSSDLHHLSRRERQIMDVVYARGRCSVADVHAAIPAPPSYSAVRTLMRILETKGHLRHEADGVRYVYLPIRSRRDAGRSAVRGLLTTFFDGSAARAVAALLAESDARLTAEEIDQLRGLVENLRKEGK
ncbi:MAG: BlaI/MecI/CopY family transcriptional regulator [Planctomycetota bacterium]|nr:BlaI/MecI/CopY family transcriptional regulator [Planctomycetota bacterium]